MKSMRPDQRYWKAGSVYEVVDYFNFPGGALMEPGDRIVLGDRIGECYEALSPTWGKLFTSGLAHSVKVIKEIE